MESTIQNERERVELIAQLRRKNEELLSEVGDLNRRIRLLEGALAGDDSTSSTLPIHTTVTQAVDVSRIDRALVAGIASFLGAVDLARLGRTCKRFGRTAEEEELSLVDGVARRSFDASATDEERDNLPQYDDESHTSMLFQLEELRRPPEFGRLLGHSMIYDHPQFYNRTSIGYRRGRNGPDDCEGTAISRQVMRAGRHFATFAVETFGGPSLSVGIVRPIGPCMGGIEPVKFCPLRSDYYEEMSAGRTDAWLGNVHACAYDGDSGDCHWTDFDDLHEEGWDGSDEFPMVPIEGSVVNVGLLLDLDDGTLTVFLQASMVADHPPESRRLGVMKDELAGEYVWFVSLHEPTDTSVQIRRSDVSPLAWGQASALL